MNNKTSQPSHDKAVNERIRQESPDLTELVFDLFFDAEFKGNTQINKKATSKSIDEN